MVITGGATVVGPAHIPSGSVAKTKGIGPTDWSSLLAATGLATTLTGSVTVLTVVNTVTGKVGDGLESTYH